MVVVRFELMRVLGPPLAAVCLATACAGSSPPVEPAPPSGDSAAHVPALPEAPSGDAAVPDSARDSDAPGPDGARRCHSSLDPPCANDELCEYFGHCACSFMHGRCVPRPTSCPEECPGVCGCDGNLWCNACKAKAAGVDVTASSFCKRDGGVPEGGTDGGSWIACGGPLGDTCPPDEYCRFPSTSRCGAGGALGLCAARPSGCPPMLRESCGCDGVEYPNACVAHWCGVDDDLVAACGPP